MVVALIALSAILAFAMGVPRLVDALNKRGRTTRVKNFMAHLETRVRGDSVRGDSYIDCPGTCTPSPLLMARYHAQVRAVLGAQCPVSNPACGVLMELQDAGTKLRLTLTYQGDELSLAPRRVEISKPNEFSSLRCNDLNAPIFKGRLSNGSARCQALPLPCPPGQVLRGIRWSQMSYICQPVPMHRATCPDPTYITGLSWNASYQIVATCNGVRYDPWTQVF